MNDKQSAIRTHRPASSAGARARLGAALATVLFIIVPSVASAAATPARSAAVQDNPRFARLEIDIWPEFDRRAALVILKGELAADVSLPATVSLRIPASSGGPSAVAFASAAKPELFNLNHVRTDGDDFITLRFQAPDRLIHIEFYDPLMTATTERVYSYVWPGDVGVDRLSVRLQEPAASTNVTVQPPLQSAGAGADGLAYRSAEIGALEAGKTLPIEIRYTKSDPRTSTEILGLKAPDTASPALSTSAPLAATAGGEGVPEWLIGLATAVLLSMAAVVGSLWWRARRTAVKPQAEAAAYCTKCGHGLGPDDRFCPACGAPVRTKKTSGERKRLS